MSRPFHLLSLVLIVAVLSMSACRFGQTTEDKPLFVIVLVDETGSFGPNPGALLWDEAKNKTEEIVGLCQGGERFLVIGIDDHGFDTDDIRFAERALDDRPLMAVQQKREWIEEWSRVERRTPRTPETDILGALYQAAFFAKRQPRYKPVILIFSDMVQEPKYPTLAEAADLSFPADSRCLCLYVLPKGRNTGWEDMMRVWIPIFQTAGLDMTEDKNFYPKGTDIDTPIRALFEER